jgi:hypothetical protein
VGDQRRRGTHARGRRRGFAAGVASANHNDIERCAHRGLLSRGDESGKTIRVGGVTDQAGEEGRDKAQGAAAHSVVITGLVPVIHVFSYKKPQGRRGWPGERAFTPVFNGLCPAMTMH